MTDSQGTCRDCRHYPIERVKDKAGRVRNDRVAACQWAPPPVPIAFDPPRFRTYTEPRSGSGCPTFERRPKEQKG